MILSKAESGMSADEPKNGLTAALPTRMSIGPSRRSVSATRFSSCSLWPTWQGTTIASPAPSAHASLMPFATSSQTSALRLETTTLAPWPAIASAIARPMPLDEPVITATLPVRSNIFLHLLP